MAALTPMLPRRRYSIFAGTNTPEEWWSLALGARRAPGQVEAYEAEFARAAGTRAAVSFGAGRMALFAILEALGIGRGDEVVIPAFTCVVVPNAILYRGARPVYVDIDPVTFNIDAARMERAITPRTRALYAQHTFGVPCEMDAIAGLAQKHGLPIIEDAAHALGATYRGRPAGSLGDVAFFSTDHSKMISTAIGGMATTNDGGIAAKLRSIQHGSGELSRAQARRAVRTLLYEYSLLAPAAMWIGSGALSLLRRMGATFQFDDELLTSLPKRYPYPCKLPQELGGVGVSQLRRLQENLAHRRALAEWLESKIGWYGGGTAFGESRPSWLRYSFLVSDRGEFERRAGRRFDRATWFTSIVHGRDDNFEAVAYAPGDCLVAERAAKHIVNLPTHPRIPLEILREFWSDHGHWVRDNLVRGPMIVA